jgi:hypothetical protein
MTMFRKNIQFKIVFIQIVPQVASMSDRADKLRMVTKLPTISGENFSSQ